MLRKSRAGCILQLLMRYLPLFFLALLFSCSSKQSIINKYLNAENLPVQQLTININADTTLLLQNGTRLIIPAGSLKTKNGQSARLIVKEALTIQQIVLAGLSTESNGKPLRSGGMLFLDAAPGEDVEIVKPITAEIPTQSADSTMKLYKGEVKDDGSINWTDPEPLETKANPALAVGEQLFKQNCASCHHLMKKGTGPALFGAEKRIGSMDIIYEWVKNPAATMQHRPYFCDLKNQYGGVMMQAFPLLEPRDIDAIFLYINKEGMKLNGNKEYVKTDSFNYDSCEYYLAEFRSLSTQKDSLAKIKEKFIQLKQTYPDSTSVYFRGIPIKIPSPDIVSPPDYDADHYIIKIEALGWYNVDVPLGNIETDSELFVTLSGDHANKNEVFLVIPSTRTFQRGGFLNDNTKYGFYEKSGKIGLEQGQTAYVFAVGESPDTAQLYFGSVTFTTSKSQDLKIKMQKVTKEQLQIAITRFKFDDVTAAVQRTFTKETLNSIENKLQLLRMKAPRCICNSDSAAGITSEPL